MDGIDRLLAGGYGVLTLAEARRAGVTEAAVRWAHRSGRLVRLAQGSYAARAHMERLDAEARHLLQVRAALRRCPGTVAAGESAAILWGLPRVGRVPERPVVLRPRGADRPEHGQGGPVTVRRAWLGPDETTVRRGIPVTALPRTVVDASRGHRLAWALAFADGARRLGASREELLDAAHRQPRAVGHAVALLAAHESEQLAESTLESLARGVQLELGLPRPRLQVWVGDPGPEYRVDMLVEEHRTVIEADGRVKYEGPGARPGQVWGDKRRLDRLLEIDLDCHRFVMADLRRPVEWGRSLLRTFARSARRCGRPVPVFAYPWC